MESEWKKNIFSIETINSHLIPTSLPNKKKLYINCDDKTKLFFYLFSLFRIDIWIGPEKFQQYTICLCQYYFCVTESSVKSQPNKKIFLFVEELSFDSDIVWNDIVCDFIDQTNCIDMENQSIKQSYTHSQLFFPFI